jgi:hypothetical protein
MVLPRKNSPQRKGTSGKAQPSQRKNEPQRVSSAEKKSSSRRGMANQTLANILSEAQSELWNAWERARNFKHSGIRGDTREEAVRSFLSERLPKTFNVVQGEVIDYCDTHSTQLDVAIYDSIRNFPILSKQGQESVILPAEALLSAVEVKSILTLDELKTCFEAVQQ